MIDELQHVMELAQQQPEEEQRQIAQLILEELADRAWETSPEFVAAMTEAHEEIARGEVLDFEAYDRARQVRQHQTE